MTQPPPPTDAPVCWQCGKPAEADCTYVKRLIRYPPHKPSNWSWRPRRPEATRLPIPRCGRCLARNWIVGGVAVFAFFGGGMVAGGVWPAASRWIYPVGAFAGLGAVILAFWLYGKAAHLRSIGNYPPLKRLRAEGWTEPD